MIKEAELKKKQTLIKLPKTEILEIRQRLEQKKNDLNKKYQKISHMKKVDSIGLKKKKILWEQQMSQIEKDLEVMGKESIFVDISC